MRSNIKRLELLAPAKNFEQGRDALLCGADAIYVGAPRFGARVAAGVARDDTARLCGLAHVFGARVYVAMNTLLWEEELRDAERIATEMYAAGADALIVQDMAYLRMDIPPIDLHASTQMFNTIPRKATFLRDAGFSRVVTERALSLDEITAIAATGVEVEAFIHGAICVGFSGRCWMSRTTSIRSGNRGECSQSCRLPYNLLNNDFKPLIKDKHLLSLQDMNLTEHLEPMIDAGVTSFKIEGRLKDAAYVRNTVSWYRCELDRIIAGRSDLRRSSEGTSEVEFEPDTSKTFSRGATSYFITGMAGRPHPGKIASFDSPKSQGGYLGRVTAVGGDWFEIESSGGSGARSESVSSGDGISFTLSDGTVSGININKAEGKRLWPNRMDGIARGMEIYRNYDRLAVTAIENSRLRRVLDASAKVMLSAERISLKLECGGVQAEVSTNEIFDEARDRDKAEATIRTQIAKTGDTIYRITGVDIEGGVRFVPISTLNELRRNAVGLLDKRRAANYSPSLRRPENMDAKYPVATLTAEDNVTNSLAERFYREHGVTEIARGLDLEHDLTTRRVMQTMYCLRNELGWCLKNGPDYKGNLYIENGKHIYELRFDCERCGMDIIYMGNKK